MHNFQKTKECNFFIFPDFITNWLNLVRGIIQTEIIIHKVGLKQKNTGKIASLSLFWYLMTKSSYMKDDWKLLVKGFYPQVQKIQKYIKGPTKKKFPQVIYTSQVISSRCKDNIQTNMNTRNITFLSIFFKHLKIHPI